MTNSITYISVDQDYQNEQTNFWFNVDGTEYGLVNCCGDLSLVNGAGYPVEECNYFDGVKDRLADICKAVNWNVDKL